ncbi:MAG: hypothetical protein A2V64_09470 [Bacteroidetes bacterium RBG_13_43_22]|nr:MAG: hypothetical protein A2V64_09470 [Bacteroidetes bacterium RBG_13_43_22]
MSSYEDLAIVGKYIDKVNDFLDTYKEYRDKADSYDYVPSLYKKYSDMASSVLDSTKIYMEKIDSIKLHYVPEAIGWKLTHSFRAKTLWGNFGIDQYLFVLNKDLTKVIEVVDLTEE